jgi:hypothetical protein
MIIKTAMVNVARNQNQPHILDEHLIVTQFANFLNTLKTKFLLNNIYKSSSYLTGNTLRLH